VAGLDASILGATPQMATFKYTAQVFDGSGKWTSGSNGDWGTAGNWTDANGIHAKPGTFAGFAGSDTAVFDGTGAGGTIGLDGTSPSLKSIQFNGATAYTVQQGTGSASITMKADSGNASISAGVTGGAAAHAISAPISALSNLDLSQTGAASLTLNDITTAAATTLTVTASSVVAAGDISGAGSTAVNGSLTANSIVQDTLSIGAGGSVTIREVPVAAGASAVPEPGTWALLMAAAACLAVFARVRRVR
jgi:hypothetical protein